MIITVLWEDQLGVQTRWFGPHELVLSAVADDLGSGLAEYHRDRTRLASHVKGVPKKGNGNVLRAIQKDASRLHGPIVAVLDRDKAYDLCKHATPRPTNCMQGISRQFRASVPETVAYDLVFLVNNTETLLEAVCDALNETRPAAKPTPDERDRILLRATWAGPELRSAVRQRCPSFDRIVKTVAAHERKR